MLYTGSITGIQQLVCKLAYSCVHVLSKLQRKMKALLGDGIL